MVISPPHFSCCRIVQKNVLEPDRTAVIPLPGTHAARRAYRKELVFILCVDVSLQPWCHSKAAGQLLHYIPFQPGGRQRLRTPTHEERDPLSSIPILHFRPIMEAL